MKTKISLVLLLLLLSVAPISAQNISTTTCPGAGCFDLNVANQGSIGIQITGTWVGTITFQATINNSTYTSLRVISAADTSAAGVTTTTANGIWNATIAGYSQVRIVFTAYTSGTAVVNARVTSQAVKFNGSGGSGGCTGYTGDIEVGLNILSFVDGCLDEVN